MLGKYNKINLIKKIKLIILNVKKFFKKKFILFLQDKNI